MDEAALRDPRFCQKPQYRHEPLVLRSVFAKLNLFFMWVVGIAWSTPRPTTTADRACVRLGGVCNSPHLGFV